MRLAFCLFKFFPFGGLQRDFLRIARECVRRGHEVHVFTMAWEGEEEPGFNLHIIPARGSQNHTRIQSYIHKVKEQLKAEKYDLVIGFNRMPGLDLYYAADVCYQARAREKHRWIHRLLPRYKRMVENERAVFERGLATQIMLIAPQQQKEFIHYYQTESERFSLLPPGIARDRIAPTNAHEIRQVTRNRYHILEDDFLLLMVGSGFKTKGVDRAIAALAALPQELKQKCHLFVLGQDNSRLFQTQADNLQVGEQVRFLGGRSDVSDFLLAADLLLHPAYHENTGTALLEALVAGLPVLTVDVCGYAHYVTAANAGVVLTSPFQQAAFNAALQSMLLSPIYPTWRSNALAFAQSADIYSLPTKAADLIEQALA